MQITPLTRDDLPAAAELFARRFQALRRSVPELPDKMENPDKIVSRLEHLLSSGNLLGARGEDGQLEGYLGWYIVDDFRGAGRRAAYCPEWAHAILPGAEAGIYRALYRPAARRWAEAGCQAHVLTLLANDAAAEKFWYWSGFGLLVVDGVRSMQPLQAPISPGCSVRRATPPDAAALAELDVEHCRHYSAAPVFMAPLKPGEADFYAGFVQQPGHSAWLALAGGHPVGFMRFEPGGDGADALNAPGTIGITGAYLRPEQRGLGLAAVILDCALQDYAARGFVRCAVDFEAFNPEAAAFWMKTFQPVCYSLMRVPEYLDPGTEV